MSTLHTANRSPFEHGALAGCLARVRPGSAVLLIEDGVLGALAGSPHAARLEAVAEAGVEVFALGPDLDARGIEAGPPGGRHRGGRLRGVRRPRVPLRQDRRLDLASGSRSGAGPAAMNPRYQALRVPARFHSGRGRCRRCEGS